MFKFTIETTDNLIATLRPYIQGHVNLREASPSQQITTPKKIVSQSRSARKKVKKMSESEDSISIDEEDNHSTPGVELASGVLSSYQNKIRREIVQKKLVRKGQVLNSPITHMHQPPLDVKGGRRPLEIREPHKMHVQNLKKR